MLESCERELGDLGDWIWVQGVGHGGNNMEDQCAFRSSFYA